MGKLQLFLIRLFIFFGIVLTSLQVVVHLRGGALCFNGGCRIVEGYLSLSPTVVNILGLVFFLGTFTLTFLMERHRMFSWLFELLVLCGFVSEGILLSVQIFVANTFCSFCLVICAIVVLVGLVYRPRLFLTGLFLVGVEICLFATIQFPFASNVSLNSGTYAVKACSRPVSVGYLIFSENCPHCKKVLDALHGCVSCEIHFNPISKIDKEILPGLLPLETYYPEINILALKIFGIDTVPVIIEQTENGFSIIKGERAIIHYIKEKCFCGRGKNIIPGASSSQDILAPEHDGVCSVFQECK